MKLSLVWIGEHINRAGPQDSILEYADDIVRKLIRSTAEIELVEKLAMSLEYTIIATYVESTHEHAIFHDSEHRCQHTLPLRASLVVGQRYILVRDEKRYRYATAKDFHGAKDTLLPPVHVTDADLSGAWRGRCEPFDIRLTIENKAINHRPDLWSHRGFAREVAALMGWTLKPLEQVALPIPQARQNAISTKSCDYFATLHMHGVQALGSTPWIALRLIRLESRPISLLVDLSNYLMFDIGQPLHAFDAAKIAGKLQARQATQGEELVCLDGVTRKLTPIDCVIADEKRAQSLAGIMGGVESGVTDATTAVILEAAHFSPQLIRKSSQQHQVRTEASTRFEKGTDVHTILPALGRYVFLLQEEEVFPALEQLCVTDMHVHESRIIDLSHMLVEQKAGVPIAVDVIVSALTSFGCQVTVYEGGYRVAVPSWRMTDLEIPEDCIEEIVRSVGYDALPPQLPARVPMIHNNRQVHLLRKIRHFCAFGLRMQEVASYPLYDQEWLTQAGIQISSAATLRNPVSEQWQQLVTSLIPHLLKQIASNVPEVRSMRMFEIGVTWRVYPDKALVERKKLSWIWYEYAARSKDSIDFYAGKNMVLELSELVGIPLEWRAPQQPLDPWWDQAKTAALFHGEVCVGYAGLLSQPLLAKSVQGSAFALEIDADVLQQWYLPLSTYQPVSKYPQVVQDISLFVSYALSVKELTDSIARITDQIVQVLLIDMFEKPEWKDKRSLTFRITFANGERTMVREEVDQFMEKIQADLRHRGVEIR